MSLLTRRHSIAITLAGLVLLACPLLAAHHLNGTWSFEVALGDGQGGTATITLEEGEDGALTGSYAGALGTADVAGEVDGTSVTLSFDSQAGKVTFEGTVQDDGTITGDCTYGQLGAGTFVAEKK